jgi:hypothetical protein
LLFFSFFTAAIIVSLKWLTSYHPWGAVLTIFEEHSSLARFAGKPGAPAAHTVKFNAYGQYDGKARRSHSVQGQCVNRVRDVGDTAAVNTTYMMVRGYITIIMPDGPQTETDNLAVLLQKIQISVHGAKAYFR